MAITQAQAIWLCDEELIQHVHPSSRWHLFPKGATVYLLSTSWLSGFRLKLFSALETGAELTVTECPIDNSAIETLIQGDKTDLDMEEVFNSCVLLPESVYCKLFRHLCGDVNKEIKGWVMWEPGFTLRLHIRCFNIVARVSIEGEVWPYSLTFEENETMRVVEHRLQVLERRLLTGKHVGFWQMRTKRSGEEITQLIRSGVKIDTYAEKISYEMFDAPVLSVLNTLDLVVIVKVSMKNKLMRSLNPKKLFFHDIDESAVGIENLGNTCFLNSILQSLAHIPQIAIHYFKAQGDPRRALNCQLGQLVKSKYAREGGGCLVPSDLKQTLGTSFIHYTKTQQQDAEELLLRMLQHLLSEEAEDVSQMYTHPGSSLIPSLSILLKHISENYSFLASQFTGLYQESVMCGNCKFIRVQYTPFVTFSLYLTPMRLFTVRYIDHSPTVLQKTFRVDIETPMEQDISLLNIWTAINEKTGNGQMLMGLWKNNQFCGPLELDYAPSQHPIVVFRLPDYSKGKVTVLFDVLKIGVKSHIGTRILVCNESDLINTLPDLIVSYLADLANSYANKSNFYVQFRTNKVQNEQKAEMRAACSLLIVVKEEESGQSVEVDLDIGRMGGERIAMLKRDEGDRREVRLRCIFGKLPKLVIEALRAFKEDKNITVKKYSDKTVSVTLHQLIAYNCREQAIDGTVECDECRVSSQRTMQMWVERFPSIAVFPIHRGVVKEGELQKSQMEVCFPAARLDLSGFEHSPAPSPAVYDLVAVVKHLGKGYSRGHYVAYAKHPVNSGWYFCSDKKCMKVREEEVVRSGEASLLVYTRK